ncbi:MAG: tetratricopeptide repeat protein [Saprospiraceae bacterium]
MKAISILFIYLLTLNLLHAQQDLRLPGEVVRQNSRVKTGQVEYLSNVNIQATQATPRFSDAKGQFTLVFADKPVYNVTRIFATKNHMEVVNKTDLERAAVIGRLSKLRIIMCPADELLENQLRYYCIAEESIVKRFKLRISRLEQANADLDALIASVNKDFHLEVKTKKEAIYALEKEWGKALEAALEIAEKFAAINLDDADQLYLQADAAFKKGDFDQVLELLKYDLIEKNLRNIQSNLSAADTLTKEGQHKIAKGQENLRQTIQNALFGARVAKLNGSWKKAEDYYDLAVKGDETDLKVVFEAAVFLQKQNQFAKARQYYDQALEQPVQPYGKSAIFNNLGILLKDNNMMIEAKKAFEEALHIISQLAAKNPSVYLPDVVPILINLGVLLSASKKMMDAKQAFEEALLISRRLAAENPDVYEPHVAMALNNLGALLDANNEIVGAKQAYEEALQIRRQLAGKNPDAYLPHVANTLNNLGVLLLYAYKEVVGAQKAYEEALEIYRQLATKNPHAYLPGLASTLNNLGILLKNKDEMIEAKQAYEEALQIRRQLAAQNPQAYNLEVVMMDINIGLFYKQLLKTTGDMSLKKAGLDLMQDANRRLSMFLETHPLVQQYRPNIQQLIDFFQAFDKTASPLSQKLNRVDELEKLNNEEKDPRQMILRQKEIISMLLEVESIVPPGKEQVTNKLIASRYGFLAWYQLFDQQFAAAEQSALTGIKKDPGEEWIHANLAIALLYQGKWVEARQIYTALKDKPYGEGTYKDTFLKGLEALKEAGIVHPDIAKARQFLLNK